MSILSAAEAALVGIAGALKHINTGSAEKDRDYIALEKTRVSQGLLPNVRELDAYSSDYYGALATTSKGKWETALEEFGSRDFSAGLEARSLWMYGGTDDEGEKVTGFRETVMSLSNRLRFAFKWPTRRENRTRPTGRACSPHGLGPN